MLKPKLILDYVKHYLNETARLVSNVPEETCMLLPDHLVTNQEVQIYITTKTGIAIDYVGLNNRQSISIHGSDLCFDDLLFPPTEFDVPHNQGALKLKPLAKSSPSDPITTLKFMGDMSGIVLFRVTGGGHLFAYDDEMMESNYGRHTIFNLYVQRVYSDEALKSRWVRYAELYPNKAELFTRKKAILNAKADLDDYLDFVTKPDFGPIVQRYVKIGDVVHKLRKDSVVVLGKDTPLLRRIRDELRTMKYNSFLVKEQPDIPDQSAEEKANLYTLMSKFAVMEDSEASGHILEYSFCKDNRVVLILLRKKGMGSTWMIGDSELVDVNYIKTFEYTDRNLHEVLFNATKWAEAFIDRRIDAYDKHYPWRREH